jgi:hypothetical protein
VFGQKGVIRLLVQGVMSTASAGCVFVCVTEDCILSVGDESSSPIVAGVVSLQWQVREVIRLRLQVL